MVSPKADEDLELLRAAYRHLKRTGFSAGAPSRARVEDLFKRLADLLKAGGGVHRNLVLNTDGASRGNPGPAGAGGVLADAGGTVLDSYAVFLGEKTNNEAEYMALIEGLKRAALHRPSRLVVRSDSLLLVKQMRGDFRVKKRDLVRLHLEARRHFPACPVVFEHVPREQNAAADRLASLGVEAGAERGVVDSSAGLD